MRAVFFRQARIACADLLRRLPRSRERTWEWICIGRLPATEMERSGIEVQQAILAQDLMTKIRQEKVMSAASAAYTERRSVICKNCYLHLSLSLRDTRIKCATRFLMRFWTH